MSKSRFKLAPLWLPPEADQSSTRRWLTLPYRRLSANVQLRPQRWNWELIMRPLDHSVERQAQQPLQTRQLLGLRYFWLDGLFSATAEAFFLNFIPLFAVAYGASNGQVGWIAAIGNLMGALALFPGAQAVEKVGSRRSIVVWTGGGVARAAILTLALAPLLFPDNGRAAILMILLLNGIRAFAGNFANPAWTAMVADLVPDFMRGRYFSGRNVAMGAATLLLTPLAGWIIAHGNGVGPGDFFGYQVAFVLAFALGMVATLSFGRIPEPQEPAEQAAPAQARDGVWRSAARSPGFLGFVISAFIWNVALHTAGPFFNVYLIKELGGTTATVGMAAAVTSLFSLLSQPYWGRFLDRRGSIRMQNIAGYGIIVLPALWIVATAPWHVYLINAVGGLMWAGFNLANFNLLLELTPNGQRHRAVALYQTVVFGAAFIGPLLGGYLADAAGFYAIFGLSSLGRLVAMLVLVFLSSRPALRAGKGLPAVRPTAG